MQACLETERAEEAATDKEMIGTDGLCPGFV